MGLQRTREIMHDLRTPLLGNWPNPEVVRVRGKYHCFSDPPGYPVEAVMIELILSGEFAYSMQKIAEMGFFPQLELHSHTSQYGSMTRGARFINEDIARTMRENLEEIRSGAFAREWEAERQAGLPVFNQIRELRDQHPSAEWERATRRAFRIG